MAKSTLRRLDKLLVERGVSVSREAAKELILSGKVRVSGFLQEKPASLCAADAHVEVDVPADEARWVSRGAYKLLRGLDVFGVDPAGWDCVDIGASTGGFTQVLLERGARRVAAVDVGYGQMAWSLRNDLRVRLLERTNARFVDVDAIGWRADLLTVDASFISLRLLLPNLQELLADNGAMIALVKPQFEVGRERVGRGVVRDPALHVEVLENVAAFVRERTRLSLAGATYSPIRGPEGNIEFIFFLTAASPVLSGEAAPENFESLVREAHEYGSR